MSAFYSCWGWKEAVKKKKPFPNLFKYVPALLSPHANCCNTSFTLYSEEAVKLHLNVTFNAVWRWCTIFFSFYNHKNSHGVKMTLWHVRNMVTHDFICTITFIQKQPIVPIVISNLYRMFLKFEFSRLNYFLFQCPAPASKLVIGASMSYLWEPSCLFKEDLLYSAHGNRSANVNCSDSYFMSGLKCLPLPSYRIQQSGREDIFFRYWFF